MTMPPLLGRGLATAASVILLDQIVKWWVLQKIMLPPRLIDITPFFNLVLTWNRGVSFGMFNTDSPINVWLLPLLALAIVGMLLTWLLRAERATIALALGGIIGGAIGNLVDRIRFGAVADFLDFHLWGYHWPAFNVADSAITVGVAVLICDAVLGTAEERRKEARLGREAGK